MKMNAHGTGSRYWCGTPSDIFPQFYSRAQTLSVLARGNRTLDVMVFIMSKILGFVQVK